jgi:peptide-methionine (S)-S-oxide reductase
MHDPTQVNGQGPDIGENYRSAIFYMNENQQKDAKEVLKQQQTNFKLPIATEVSQGNESEFHLAEEYHQKYTQKTGMGACHVAYQELPKE